MREVLQFVHSCRLWLEGLCFLCCDKHHDGKKLGEEKVYFILQVTIHHEELRAGNQGRNPEQKLKQRPWRVAAFWISPHGLLRNLTLYSPGTSTISETTHHSMSQFDTSTSNRENAPQSCPWPI